MTHDNLFGITKSINTIHILCHVLQIMIVFLLIACASQSDWSTVAQWENFDDSDLPDQADYPDAGAVILLDEGIVEISDAGEIDFTYFERHRVVKVLNTSGYSYANISIGYNKSSDVEMIEARTISADGKITVLDDDNIFDITLYPRFIFFSDQRAKIFTFPAVDDGCILEYKYRIAMSGNTLMHSWYFQNNSPTEISRFTIETPTSWIINYNLYNIDIESNLTTIPSSGKTIRKWEARNIMEFPSEVAMPPTRNIAAHLEISPIGFNTWADVAEWYHNLCASQMIVDDDIREIALRLTADAHDELDKVKRIFEWVRDRVRYVAVSIGIGGFKPHSSDDILHNRYGDCKDMTTLFCSLAKAIDIPVQQVLISTYPNGTVDTSLVSPFQFNHVIAYYPTTADTGLWLDATKKGSPFGVVPWYNQNRLAFIIDADGNGIFKRTPSCRENDNEITMAWKVDLDSELNAVVNGINKYSGAPATDIRQSLMNLNNKQLEQWIEGYLSTRCSGIDLQSYEISNVDTVKDPLTILYQFKTELLTSKSENMAIIDLASMMMMELPDYFRSTNRESAIEFRHAASHHFELAITLPEGWTVQQPMREDSIVSPYGKTIYRWRTQENIFHVDYDYQFFGNAIPRDSYTEFQDFLEAINEQDMVPAILLKN
jgi:hypothetical protein